MYKVVRNGALCGAVCLRQQKLQSSELKHRRESVEGAKAEPFDLFCSFSTIIKCVTNRIALKSCNNA